MPAHGREMSSNSLREARGPARVGGMQPFEASAVQSDNNSTSPAAAQARLFIGLWPDDAQRWEARSHQQLWRWPPQARPTPASKLHLTLHFIGEVPQSAVEGVVQAMPASFSAAELTFSHPALWRGGIAVLEPEAVPPSLLSLHAQLGLRLRQLGISLEARPWRPHHPAAAALALLTDGAGAVGRRLLQGAEDGGGGVRDQGSLTSATGCAP